MPTRRAVLAAAAVAAGTAVVTGVTAGAAGAQALIGVPHTLGRRILVPSGVATVYDPAFVLTHLAMNWVGTAAVGLRLRTVKGWQPWRTITGCVGGRDGRAVGAAVVVDARGVVGYELKAPTPAIVTELNTVDGPVRAGAAAVARSVPIGRGALAVRYLSRAAWGADEVLRYDEDGDERFPADHWPVRTVTVHHTAGPNHDVDPAATMRAIYFDQSNAGDHGDLGYHLAIDEAGRLYEGRWSGTDRRPAFGVLQAGQPPLLNTAAHAAGHNAGNVGVALLGDLTDRAPTGPARRTLTLVLAALCSAAGLDPSGTTTYTHPLSGATRVVRTIAGHRETGATTCPGSLPLGTLRADVADLL